MEYVQVTLKRNGETKTVLKAEAEVLRLLGRLKDDNPKDDPKPEVKEKKEAPKTKERKASISSKSYGNKGKD